MPTVPSLFAHSVSQTKLHFPRAQNIANQTAVTKCTEYEICMPHERLYNISRHSMHSKSWGVMRS